MFNFVHSCLTNNFIKLGGVVVEAISESTPQMNFSLMRASSDNEEDKEAR